MKRNWMQQLGACKFKQIEPFLNAAVHVHDVAAFDIAWIYLVAAAMLIADEDFWITLTSYGVVCITGHVWSRDANFREQWFFPLPLSFFFIQLLPKHSPLYSTTL
jgi:hypothetical protein